MIKKPEGFDWSHNQSKPSATTMHDKDSINFKFKNFTSIVEANDNNTSAILNILIDENKSTQKSIALLNKNVRELIVLLKDKENRDRERRFY